MRKLWLIAAAIFALVSSASAQSLGSYIQSLPGATAIDNTWSLIAVNSGGTPFQVAPNTIGNAFGVSVGTQTVNTLIAQGTSAPGLVAGQIGIWGVTSTPALVANGIGALSLTTGGGLHLQGQGSVNDITAVNNAGTVVWIIPTGTQITQFNGNIGIGTSPIAADPIDIILTANAGNRQGVRNWNNSTTVNTQAEFVAVTGTANANTQFGQQDTASPFAYWRIGAGDIGGINIDASGASGAGIKMIPASGASVSVTSSATSTVTDLSVSDTAAGSFVRSQVVNLSSANNSSAGVKVVTGVANTGLYFQINNGVAAPFAQLFWESGITSGLVLTNNSVNIATFNNGLQVGAPTGGDKGSGTLNIQSTIWTNGTQGIASRTCTVNQALTLIFTNGLLTGGTCAS